ncbi:GNAT family N-acetyltransferase [Planctomycetota bacterium]
MLKVRKGSPEDIAHIVEFQIAMALETEDLTLDRKTVLKGVTGVFDEPSRGSYYMTELDGKVVGSLLTIPEWSDWRNGTVLWIHSLYVLPEARGKGVFKALYLFIKTIVGESPRFRGIRLYVDKTNTNAQAVYEKMGMTAEHYELYEWMREF